MGLRRHKRIEGIKDFVCPICKRISPETTGLRVRDNNIGFEAFVCRSETYVNSCEARFYANNINYSRRGFNYEEAFISNKD